MTVAKCGAGSTYPSGAHEFTSSFQWGPCLLDLQLFVQCFVDHCFSFCTFFLAIVLSFLRFTASDYPFVIFKFFLSGNQDRRNINMQLTLDEFINNKLIEIIIYQHIAIFSCNTLQTMNVATYPCNSINNCTMIPPAMLL